MNKHRLTHDPGYRAVWWAVIFGTWAVIIAGALAMVWWR